MSLPSSAARARRSSSDVPRSQSRSQATSAAAASAEPPAMPPATGMSLRTSNVAVAVRPACAASSRAARSTMLSGPVGTSAGSMWSATWVVRDRSCDAATVRSSWIPIAV